MKPIEVTVKVLVTGAGPKPVVALKHSGEIKNRPAEVLRGIKSELQKMGLSCQTQADGKNRELLLVIPRKQWNVSGVRDSVKNVVSFWVDAEPYFQGM